MNNVKAKFRFVSNGKGKAQSDQAGDEKTGNRYDNEVRRIIWTSGDVT